MIIKEKNRDFPHLHMTEKNTFNRTAGMNPNYRNNRVPKATIEILYPDEKPFGSKPAGEFLVREFDQYGVELSGSFFKTMDKAEAAVRRYMDVELHVAMN
jgi:hypothetical protein